MKRLLSISVVTVLIMTGFLGMINIVSYTAQGTFISGTLYDGSGGPLTPSGSPYIVVGYITVPVGQTLTIEPGVEVRFNKYFGIYVNGNLNAIGTEANRIKMTSNMSSPKK